MNELVDKYFEQIQVESTDLKPVREGYPFSAHLILNFPTQMLREYQRLRGSGLQLEFSFVKRLNYARDRKLPDVAAFWRETGLGDRLRNSGKQVKSLYAPLNDVLDFLEGEVYGQYYVPHSSKRIKRNDSFFKSLERIQMDITEYMVDDLELELEVKRNEREEYAEKG